MDATPKIREIHPIPYAQNGHPAYLLRDPLQLNGHMLVIPQEIAPILFLADGTRDLDTICKIFEYHYGLRVTVSDVEGVLQAFDDAYLLENERAGAAREAALEAYRSAPYRPPSSAGGSYPADPAELHRFLQDYLEEADIEPDVRTARGVLSPHIDYDRGARTYARVWKRAAGSLADADLIVIIGTDHYGGDNEITLTLQNYATPFGVLPTDVEIVEQLAQAVGRERAFRGELFHKNEHSLELPLVWLHHLLGERRTPVVPVLCGRLDPEGETTRRFVAALARAAAGRRVFTVISGDLAHVGPAFGGEALGGAEKEAVHAADERLLEQLEAGREEDFLAEILKDQNANNVCGAYPLYLAMRVFGFSEGESTGYQQCPADDEDTSIVSIGGIVFR